tara:strand:+ start:4964 stop:5350 length:387 start_codon:yes stop_codon:yes gene_type:complete
MRDLIVDDPENWILQILYNANRPDEESLRIYKCLHRYIHDNRNFIGVLEHISPTELRVKPLPVLADDCFFSVTFCSGYIANKAKTRGLPDVEFYKQTGQNAYSSIGYSNIANNWDFWSSYVTEYIILD